jgi:hypothetical protein
MTIVGPILDTVAISHDVEGVLYKESGWRINSFLLRLFAAPALPSRFASWVVTPLGYKAGSRSYVQPMSSRTISHHLPTSFHTTEKKDRWRNRSRNRTWLLSLHGVASPFLLIHGGVGLDHVGGYARASKKPCELGICDGGGARVLHHARGSCIPHSGRGDTSWHVLA